MVCVRRGSLEHQTRLRCRTRMAPRQPRWRSISYLYVHRRGWSMRPRSLKRRYGLETRQTYWPPEAGSGVRDAEKCRTPSRHTAGLCDEASGGGSRPPIVLAGHHCSDGPWRTSHNRRNGRVTTRSQSRRQPPLWPRLHQSPRKCGSDVGDSRPGRLARRPGRFDHLSDVSSGDSVV